MRAFKINRCGCPFYSPIRCETVELLFNFRGGGLVRDLASGLGGEEEEEKEEPRREGCSVTLVEFE